MTRFILSVVFAAQIVLTLGAPTALLPFVDPTLLGGSLLDDAGGGLGEPLNVRLCCVILLYCTMSYRVIKLILQVIISGLSSADVLTDDGFTNFARAAGMYASSYTSPPARFLSELTTFTAVLGQLNAWVFTSGLLRVRIWAMGTAQ